MAKMRLGPAQGAPTIERRYDVISDRVRSWCDRGAPSRARAVCRLPLATTCAPFFPRRRPGAPGAGRALVPPTSLQPPGPWQGAAGQLIASLVSTHFQGGSARDAWPRLPSSATPLHRTRAWRPAPRGCTLSRRHMCRWIVERSAAGARRSRSADRRSARGGAKRPRTRAPRPKESGGLGIGAWSVAASVKANASPGLAQTSASGVPACDRSIPSLAQS